MYLFGEFLLGGSHKCGKLGSDHRRKNNFSINNSVELSMCKGLTETVKYIWMSILYILDWIFSQNCRNSPPLHAAGELARNTKS